MSSSRLSRKHIVPSSIIVLLVFPILLAAFAPILAPIPTASAGWTAPPLPDPDEPLPDFQHLLEPFPIVSRDLPDPESLQFVNLYDETTYSDHIEALALLDAAHEAIEIPDHLQRPWETWLTDSGSRTVPSEVMEALAADPLNGDRLSNLATAMFFYSIVNEPNAIEGAPYHAIKPAQLMHATVKYFPDSRDANLNGFYFRFFTQPWAMVEKDLVPWMRANPDDVAILRLSVEKSISHHDLSVEFMRDFLIEYSFQLTKSDDPIMVAFGYAMLGDLHLGNLGLGDFMGNSRQENAPFTIMHNARNALGYYDQAIQHSDDPSLYLARAFTLSILGDEDAAIRTLERAIEIHPDITVFYEEMSDLYLEKRGSVEEIRQSMLAARDNERQALSLQQNQSATHLNQTRVYNNHDSVTFQVANLPLAFSSWKGHGGGGGGYSVTVDQIPEFDSVPWDILSLSAALGDPQGVLDDAERFGLGYPEHDVAVAQLVADPASASREDLRTFPLVHSAIDWLRFAGQFEQARQLCEAALDVVMDEPEGPGYKWCIADTSYLLGDLEAAQKMYHSLDADESAGFVAEMRGNFDDAEAYYSVELNARFSTRYMAMLRMGGVQLASGDYENAIQHYDEWLEWAVTDRCDLVKCISCVSDDCQENTHMIPYVLSNRGIARLQMNADRNGNIDCSGYARDACLLADRDFEDALEYDPHNPVFLMNKAWVARLLGNHDQSTELMTRALESDPTLYPVLVDMGVYAAQNDDPEAAHQYFLDAVAANPKYDLGWWNLGVLEMRKGPSGILRGQAYLARALVQNPSLATSSLNFKTDESIYRVEITEQIHPGAGWSFATASSLATSALGFLAAAFIVFQATTHVLKDKLIEFATTKIDSAKPWLDEHISPLLKWFQGRTSATWILLTLTIVVMVIAAIVPAWRGDPGAASATIALALFALVFAVVTHECGHRLSAQLMKAELEPVQWAPGIGLALFLLPFNLSSGPFPAQRVKSGDDTTTLWVYLFGPLANLGVAACMYAVYLIQPLPVLRLIAITQLAVMSYSLLPFEPLDGAPLARAQPKLVAGLASFALLAGVLFSVGIL